MVPLRGRAADGFISEQRTLSPAARDGLVYTSSLEGVGAEHLSGFFEGWSDPPSQQTHLRILANSDHVILAIQSCTKKVVGFVTALTDGMLAAYVTLLEVLPAHRGVGIGSRLVERLMERLDGIYMVDAVCDDRVVPFYSKLGFSKGTAVMRRDYQKQSGRPSRDGRVT